MYNNMYCHGDVESIYEDKTKPIWLQKRLIACKVSCTGATAREGHPFLQDSPYQKSTCRFTSPMNGLQVMDHMLQSLLTLICYDILRHKALFVLTWRLWKSRRGTSAHEMSHCMQGGSHRGKKPYNHAKRKPAAKIENGGWYDCVAVEITLNSTFSSLVGEEDITKSSSFGWTQATVIHGMKRTDERGVVIHKLSI